MRIGISEIQTKCLGGDSNSTSSWTGPDFPCIQTRHVPRRQFNRGGQWRSYRGQGASPRGSILALKKYRFSYVATNVKSFFGWRI